MATATKGKTVGCWLSAESVDALNRALADLKARGAAVREGTYGADAIVARLVREGYLENSRTADVAARAAELAVVLGPDVVDAKLGELAIAAAEIAAERQAPEHAGVKL